MEHHCPSCQRPIATRRHRLCQFCGEPLPKELLFSDEEEKSIEDQLTEMSKRRQRKGPLDTNDSGDSDVGFD